MGIRACVLTVLPQCHFCKEVARYDFRLKHGDFWAFGCEKHWREYRSSEGLGLGEGQLLLSRSEVNRLYNSFKHEEIYRSEE